MVLLAEPWETARCPDGILRCVKAARRLFAWWKNRRLQLALGQIAAGEEPTVGPLRAKQGAAMSRLLRPESHTDWKGD